MMGSPQDRDTSLLRYTNPAILLHWLVALLIITVAGIGLYFGVAPRVERPFWLNLHATTGLAMAIAIVARSAWRIVQAPPPWPDGASRLEERGAQAVHLLMYVLMIAIPLFGLVAFIWHARVFDFGVFHLNFGVASERAVYSPAQSIHKWIAYGFLILIALHVLAALWHRFILRDQRLERIFLPPRPSARLTADLKTEEFGSERSNHVHSA